MPDEYSVHRAFLLVLFGIICGYVCMCEYQETTENVIMAKKNKLKEVTGIKRNKEWIAMDVKLKDEGIGLLLWSKVLMNKSVEVLNKIEERERLYPDDVVDRLPWEDKEKMIVEVEKLDKELSELSESLRVLDDAKIELAEKVNKFYGRDVMSLDKIELDWDNDLEEDSANWWKKI